MKIKICLNCGYKFVKGNICPKCFSDAVEQIDIENPYRWRAFENLECLSKGFVYSER